MSLVIRRDLGMSCGKAAAQAAHGAVECVFRAMSRREWRGWLDEWLREGQKKIVLAVDSLDDLLRLRDIAERLNLPNAVISDAGLTELEPGTITVLCVGPAPDDLVDSVTGKLRLFR